MTQAIATPTGRKRGKNAVAVVTLTERKQKKTKVCIDDVEHNWSVAMSIFTKFQPGLGHDGVGLYGTPTPASARKVLDRLDVCGRTHIDIGAADGKMLLGAMALGAERSFGIELAGDCLVAKFNAMRNKLSTAITSGPSSLETEIDATLACNTDIIHLSPDGVHQWIADVFGREPGNNIVLSAVWHGFTIDAKKALLKAIAMSHGKVQRISFVGPIRKDFGHPDEIIQYLTEDCAFPGTVDLAHHDNVKLKGGEAHRAITFHLHTDSSSSEPDSTLTDYNSIL